MTTAKRLLPFFCAVLVAGGCGFHLRGFGGRSGHVESVLLVSADGSDEQAVSAFKRILQSNGIALARDNRTPWKIVLDGFTRKRNQTAIGGDESSTREIQLVDGYRVTVFKNGVSMGSLAIDSRSTVEYSSAQYIGSAEEEENAHRQLAEENAHAALRYLDSRAVQAP